jgi:hypothetical protein
MSDNPMTDAFDAAENEQTSSSDNARSEEFDAEQYLEALNSDGAPKEKTVGMAVTTEMHAFYQELQNSDQVDVTPSQSIRDHLEKLAHRHQDVFEKAMRKLEIEREF